MEPFHYNFSKKQRALRGKLGEQMYWSLGNSALGSLVPSYKELGPCQVYLLVDEWSSLSGDRSGSGAPGMGVAWGQNFPVPFSLGPTLTPGM